MNLIKRVSPIARRQDWIVGFQVELTYGRCVEIDFRGRVRALAPCDNDECIMAPLSHPYCTTRATRILTETYNGRPGELSPDRIAADMDECGFPVLESHLAADDLIGQLNLLAAAPIRLDPMSLSRRAQARKAARYRKDIELYLGKLGLEFHGPELVFPSS